MFKQLLNFDGINWWTLLGGLGLNFVITVFTSIGGAYLAVNKSTAGFYTQFGPPLMIIWIFLACGLAGYIVGKIADDFPLKHAFWASLGAIVPLLLTLSARRGLRPHPNPPPPAGGTGPRCGINYKL